MNGNGRRKKNGFHIKNVGFISTRFKGTDGVSLETQKWDEVLTSMGYNTFYFAGVSDRPEDKTMIVPEAFFEYPEIKLINSKCFNTLRRTSCITGKIHKMRRILKEALYRFVEKFNIDLIIPQNCLAIPMNLPLGMALTEFIAETGIPTISHNHDFYWERQRFLVNAVEDIIFSSFPPALPSIQHVSINTWAKKELSYRKGISSEVIPNVVDFDKKPVKIDDYNKDVRKELGVKKDELLFLQPTRIVARKGIEHSIELISRLKHRNIKLVITHSAKDEGTTYMKRIISYAKHLNVNIVIKPEIIGEKRKIDKNGRKKYTLWDIYPHADFITYPSTYEGFGNAFIEAIYFKKPILVNKYSIYSMDIAPLGFEAVEMNGFITDEVVKKVDELLNNKEEVKKMVNKNFKLAKRYFSYKVLKKKLEIIIGNFEGIMEFIDNENNDK